MDRPELLAITIVLMLVLLALLPLGWRARMRRQRDLAAPLAAPADLGEPIGTFDGKYVATTTAGDPLDRVAVRGLGFRSNASLTVTAEGLLVQRPGADDFWIPRAQLGAVRQATWTIDRVVEPGGLDLVEWTLGDRKIDSYFRMADPVAFETAMARLERTAA